MEFAKERVDRGIDVVHATLQAVQLRLRPIVMTSLAFILGVLPWPSPEVAAAVSRQTIGWTVFGGMLAATTLAIFVVPVLIRADHQDRLRPQAEEVERESAKRRAGRSEYSFRRELI